MATTAGYSFIYSVATTINGTYSEIAAVTADLNMSTDIATITDTSNAGYVLRLPGLNDTASSCEANLDVSNTAYGHITTARTNRTDLFLKVVPDGVTGNGFKLPVVVENITFGGMSMSGPLTYSVSFQGNGAVVADNA